MRLDKMTDINGKNIFKMLIKKAQDKHYKIYVIAGKNTFADSMTEEPDKILLWFDYYLDNGHRTSGVVFYNKITGEYSK